MEDDGIRPDPMAHQVGMVLDRLSIDELGARVLLLEAEIVRLKQAISSKSATRSAAEDVFKM